MKKLLAVSLLIMSSAFGQHRMESKVVVPTVRYEWIAPDCSAYPNFMDQLSSQCFFMKLRVTAHSYRSDVAGFYIVVAYVDSLFQRSTTWAMFTVTRAANGDFVQDFIIPQTLSKVSALELVAGGLAYPN